MGNNWRATWRIGSAFSACVLGLSLVLPSTALAETVDDLAAVAPIAQEESLDEGVADDLDQVVDQDEVVAQDADVATQGEDALAGDLGQEMTETEPMASDQLVDTSADQEDQAPVEAEEEGELAEEVTGAEEVVTTDKVENADETLPINAAEVETPQAAKPEESVAQTTPANSWAYEGGNYYFYDENGKKKTGWLIWNKSPQGQSGTQRYWLDTDGKLALSRLLSDSDTGDYWAYARPEGYVVRGKYATGTHIYLANNDGKLENPGWVVSNAYGDGLQRYYVESSTHAAEYTGSYASSGWDHVTTKSGYVARGRTTVNGRIYLADNNGKLSNTGWVVSNAYGDGLQRYYVDKNTHAIEAYTGNYSPSGYVHFTTKNGYVLRGKLTVDGKTFLGNNDGRLEGPGWVVTGAYDGGLQRYWIDSTYYAAIEGFSKDGWVHYTTSNGYVLRGKYTAPNKYVYLGNNDGRLEGPGWVVTGAYDGGLQRYWIDKDAYAAIPGYSAAGYPHYTTNNGYVLRGAQQDGGKTYLANNDGMLAYNLSGWVVTNIFDGNWQRYYMVTDTSTGASFPQTGFFNAKFDGYNNGAWFYGNTSKGYVVRGKLPLSAGVLLANNDGVLIENTRGTGWYVGSTYDGGLQRYYLVNNNGHLYARTGHFVVGADNYYGDNNQGYVVRGKFKVNDDLMVIGNNNGVLLWGEGWVITSKYDGEPQRYYLAKIGDLCGARLGKFSVAGSSYFGRYDTGYVVRGLYNTEGGTFYYANNNGVLDTSKNFSLLSRSYARIKNKTSSTKYLLATDCDNCHTFVYEKINGYWQIKYDWLCGTGLPIYNGGQGTVRGDYTIGGSGSCYNFAEQNSPGYVPGGYQTVYYPKDDVYYFTCFVLDLGYHSTIPSMGSAESQLGRKVSHGCIRVLYDNAKWIYYNCARGTRVVTY